MSYRITEYYAENFKRLRLVQFKPSGRITAFTGKNDQGKTSALDAIPFVLGGKKYSPETPKRKGAQHMKVRLSLGDIEVTRTESGLKLEMAHGVKAWGTPQAMLDSLFDELAFDPLEFVRMKPEQQVEMLKRCVKLDVDLDALTKENDADFATRRDINREVARLDAELAIIPIQEGLPAEKLDDSEIEARIGKANEHNRGMAQLIEKRNALQLHLAATGANYARNQQFIKEATEAIAEWLRTLEVHQMHMLAVKEFADDFQVIIGRLEDPAFVPANLLRHSTKTAYVEAENYQKSLQQQIDRTSQAVQQKDAALSAAIMQGPNLENAMQDAKAALEALPAPNVMDTSALMDELKQAQLVNREIDKRTRREGLKKQRDEKQAEADRLTRAMSNRDEKKAAAVANAKMPVDGLTFTEGEVLFEGIPLQQLGEAKQIKISIALVLARSPKLRLVVIKHGEALDDDSMAELQKMAEEHDFYVWMAKVDPSGKVGIYLEDGEVKAINEIN